MRKFFNQTKSIFVINQRPLLLMGVFAYGHLMFDRTIHQQHDESKAYNDSLNESFHRSVSDDDNFHKNVVIISGTSNQELAKGEFLDYIYDRDCTVPEYGIRGYQDFKIFRWRVQYLNTVRGKDIYLIQSTSPPVNENIMELLLLISTLKKASARKINVVIPYYGYSRQNGMWRALDNQPNQYVVPISAAVIANLLENQEVSRVISVDLHSGQIQGFFGARIPFDNLEASLVAINYFKFQNKYDLKDVVIVSPDAGGVERAKKFKDQLQFHRSDINSEFAMIIKQRDGPGNKPSIYLVGEVKDKDVILVDDMIDTAATISEAARVLKENGANKIVVFATHGLFSDKAFETIDQSQINQIIVTNTIPQKPHEQLMTNKIQRLSIAPLLAEAIYRVQSKGSLSDLFATPKITKK